MFILGVTVVEDQDCGGQKLSDQDACVDDQADQREEDAAEEEAAGQSLHLLLLPHFLKRLPLLPPHLSYLLLCCLLPVSLLHLANFLGKSRHSLEFPQEKPHKHLVPQIKLQALCRHLPPQLIGIVPTSQTGLVAVHEADCGDDERPDVPNRGPGFLVKVGKRCADREVALEAAGGRVEDELGRREGIILMELKEAVVEASGEGRFQIGEAEVEIQGAVPGNESLVDGLPLQGGLLLLETEDRKSLGLHADQIIQFAASGQLISIQKQP